MANSPSPPQLSFRPAASRLPPPLPPPTPGRPNRSPFTAPDTAHGLMGVEEEDVMEDVPIDDSVQINRARYVTYRTCCPYCPNHCPRSETISGFLPEPETSLD